MIFGANATDLTGFKNKYSLFGKPINEVIRDFKSGNSISDSLFSKINYDNGITKNDVNNIKSFIEQCKSGIPIGQAWQGTMKGSTVAAKQMAVSVKKGEVSLDELALSANVSKTSMFGAQLAATALNAAISFGLSFAISLAVKGIDYLIHREENLIKKSEEAAQTIKEIQSSFKETVSLVQDSGKRFAELAQGVDLLTGKNKNLTNDEYKEFLDISNQLAETFPTLTRNYDENGNAIVQLSGDVDTVVESLKQLLETERQLAQQEIADKLPDLYKGLKAKSEDYYYEELQKKSRINDYNTIISSMQNPVSGAKSMLETSFHTGKIDSYFKAMYGIGEGYEVFEDAFNSVYQKFKSASFDDFFDAFIIKLEDGIGKTDGEIHSIAEKNKANWSGLISGMFSWIETDSDFSLLSDSMRNMMSSVINGLDYSSLDNGKEFKDIESLQSYFKNTLLPIFQSDDIGEKRFQAFVDMQTEFNGNQCTVGEYKKNVDDIINYIDGLEGVDEETKTNIKVALGVDESSINDFNVQYGRAIEKVTKGIGNDNPLYGKFEQWVKSLNNSDLQVIVKTQLDTEGWDREHWQNYLERQQKIAFNLDLNEEAAFRSPDTENAEGISFASIMNENASATGLAAESVAALKKRYGELEDEQDTLAGLFVNTAQGVNVNTKALNQLEKAYAQQNKDKLSDKLRSLKDQYNDLTFAIDKCTDAKERESLESEQSGIMQEIKNTVVLISQYEAVTSAYQDWIAARNGTDERDMYSNVADGYKEVQELLKQGWYNDEDVNKYLDMLLNIKQRTEDNVADFEKLKQTIEGSSYSIMDFFQYDDDGNLVNGGLYNFFETVHDKLGDEYVKIQEDGSFTWDFTKGKIDEVAEALGMTTESVEILSKAMGDVTANITVEDIIEGLDELDGLTDSMQSRVSKLTEALGDKAVQYDLEFNFAEFEKDKLDAQITRIQKVISDQFTVDGAIDLTIDGANEAMQILASLYTKKMAVTEKPAIIKVNTDELDGSLKGLVETVQSFYENLETLDFRTLLEADTAETRSVLQSLATTLDGLKEKKKLNLDTGAAQEAINTLKSEDFALGKVTLSDEAKNGLIQALKDIDLSGLGISEKLIPGYDEDKDKHEVFYVINQDEIDAVETRLNNIDGKKYTAKFDLTKTSALRKYETANHDIHANLIFDVKTSGTVPTTTKVSVSTNSQNRRISGATESQGTAFANGYWGTKHGGEALGGEVGPEILVRKGRFFTIGDNGAEFFRYQPGDIENSVSA